VSALALQPDGKLIIGGFFSTVGGQLRQSVARLSTIGIKGRRGFRGRSRTPSASANFEDRMKILGGTKKHPVFSSVLIRG